MTPHSTKAENIDNNLNINNNNNNLNANVSSPIGLPIIQQGTHA